MKREIRVERIVYGTITAQQITEKIAQIALRDGDEWSGAFIQEEEDAPTQARTAVDASTPDIRR